MAEIIYNNVSLNISEGNFIGSDGVRSEGYGTDIC